MKAYSYIRWSSDAQTAGDSLKRQLEATRRICQQHSWQLDESLKPAQGQSAFKGGNLERGSLAEFLNGVNTGKILTPCVLVVEQLDRLTRTRLRDARKLFDGLLEKPLSPTTKALVEYAAKNPQAKIPLVDTEDPAEDDQIDQFDNAVALYKLIRLGVESKQVFLPTVKRTITVSREYSCRWARDNIGKVLSKNKLISLYNIPNTVAELLPDSDTQITTLPNSNVTVFAGYLEGGFSYQDTIKNKAQISQQWAFNVWSVGDKGLYDVVT